MFQFYQFIVQIFHDCMIPPCPTKSYPGIWELPLVMWNDLKVRSLFWIRNVMLIISRTVAAAWQTRAATLQMRRGCTL